MDGWMDLQSGSSLEFSFMSIFFFSLPDIFPRKLKIKRTAMIKQVSEPEKEKQQQKK